MESQSRKQTSILEIISKINDCQIKQDKPFSHIGSWRYVRGLFTSSMNIPWHPFGPRINYYVKFAIPDNNAFVTLWTLELLMEASLHDLSILDQIDVKEAVSALMAFQDKTRGHKTPFFTFWQQKRFDDKWIVFPENITPLMDIFSAYQRTLNKVEETVDNIISLVRNKRHRPRDEKPHRTAIAFALPADFDDSALNWALGFSLSDLRYTLPDAWKIWSGKCFDFNELAETAMDCAYRPFSEDKSQNTIDPRSFFAIKEFLWELKDRKKADPDYRLLTTWAMNIKQSRKGSFRHCKMPFNVNNIDISVQANFIYAAVKNALDRHFPQEENGYFSLIRNTVELLVWEIETEAIFKKPDLLLLYYPSPFCALFFVSRTVHMIESFQIRKSLPGHMRDLCVLTEAMRKKASQLIISYGKYADQCMHWENSRPGNIKKLSHKNSKFLSKFDMFTTAVVVNTLINTWSTIDNKNREWADQVPDDVLMAVKGGLKWMHENVSNASDHNENPFFSSSVRHHQMLPFLFPANRVERISMPALSKNPFGKKPVVDEHMIFAMSGVPSREQYFSMLSNKEIEHDQEENFQKSYTCEFPYWSAPSVTHALVGLAFLRGKELEV